MREDHETKLLICYWKEKWKGKGGSLIQEFCAVGETKNNGRGRRSLDGVIVLDKKGCRWPLDQRRQEGGRALAAQRDAEYINKDEHDIIIVQVKASRLGMYLLGQALFSRELMWGCGYEVKKTVALCTQNDAVLGPIAKKYGITVEVLRPESSTLGSKAC